MLWSPTQDSGSFSYCVHITGMGTRMATHKDLDGMLDRLEGDLPALMLDHPDADGAEFWIAFARRTVVIESAAQGDQVQLVRDRLDRMLNSRGLLASDDA
jgi:hypothetical protein